MLSYEKVVSSVAPVGPMEMGRRCCDLEDCLEKKTSCVFEGRNAGILLLDTGKVAPVSIPVPFELVGVQVVQTRRIRESA